MSENNTGRLVSDIIEVSENDDIFDTLILLQKDSWHNFRSRLLYWNSLEKSQEFFKELFLKCLSKSSMPEPLIIQWSQEMCEIFHNEDISEIDLKKVYQDAEELILEEKYEEGMKLYGKVIWALVQMVSTSTYLHSLFHLYCDGNKNSSNERLF